MEPAEETGPTSKLEESLGHQHLLFVCIIQNSYLHPAHRDQIIQALEDPVTYSIFRQTVHAWVMAHGHFSDREAMHECQGGEKSMHAVEAWQFVHDGTAEDFQRASGVVNGIAGDRAPHHVGNVR